MSLLSVTRHIIITICFACLSITAQASAYTLDTSQSHITATFLQFGKPLTAQFQTFKANIAFDATHLYKASAYIDLDLNSFDLGDKAYNLEVRKPTWFHTAQYPKSTFTSTSFIPHKPQADGMHYTVTGKLIIKGQSNNVTFPLTVREEQAHTIFSGTLPIRRLHYRVGEGYWQDTGMIADQIDIAFYLVTTPRTETR
jgi:polyisoprenoid-binding protein YceI